MTAGTVAGLLLMITALLVWYLRRRACIRRVGSVHSRLRIAHSLREAGHFQQAEDAYRAMLGEHRRTTRDQGFALDAATGLYLTLLDRGDWPGAETLLREIVATYDPMSPPFRMGLLHARRELAHIRLHRGEYSDAVDELRAIERESVTNVGETRAGTPFALVSSWPKH
ncbi:tetratricopeptide repeat protein [Amycolatopsis sp. K13G38]|uniref:Tetratricopeptide repeat protein n=1 Tax=Amycolatopsis acididurans TaxID=2724524 RepID=A0ABX1JB05_9PSEU|nr:tetratricopeptide repeat protein [Amycolatopsis acididurans]NKQ56970.1 tetratricopeptide repeat protein [Amycolatopsis acididurans]